MSPSTPSYCRNLAIAMLSLAVAATTIGEVYQQPSEFLAEAFQGEVPDPEVLWLGEALQERAEAILLHPYPALRVRYWHRGERTAWILEEVGKEQPITTGIVVDGDRIQRLKVLIYRESRGREVRYPAFTRQFEGAGLGAPTALDSSIDGISGATMSVTALKKLAALALVFHRSVTDD